MFFKRLHTWQLILILIPLLFVTATCLRFDHLHMVDLRDEVLSADASGDAEKISSALTELREYTFSHTVINIVSVNGKDKITFGTGPLYLEQSYLRDANAAIEKAENAITSDDNPNGNIFAAASEVCKPIAIANGWAWNSEGYISCMTSELDKYPSSSELTTTMLVDVPSTELYRYEYSSPVLSFSFTTLFVLLSFILSVVIFIRILIWLILKIALFFV